MPCGVFHASFAHILLASLLAVCAYFVLLGCRITDAVFRASLLVPEGNSLQNLRVVSHKPRRSSGADLRLLIELRSSLSQRCMTREGDSG